ALDVSVLEQLTGKTIVLGVIALDSDDVESAETVAERIARAQPYADDIVAAPDCGMKYLSRNAAYGKLEALVAGAKLADARRDPVRWRRLLALLRARPRV